MLDDFFIRALLVGIGMAIVTGPLGCFVVWRRLSFFGDTLAHSALLGITLSYTTEINMALSVFVTSSIVALILLKLQKTTNLPSDALLGLLAHSSLAIGLVVIGLLATIRFDLMGLLFGDILAVNVNDIILVWVGGAIILIVLKIIWKPLFASTVNYELAEAEGLNLLTYPPPANGRYYFVIGSREPSGWIDQSVEMFTQLTRSGSDCKLYIVEDGAHFDICDTLCNSESVDSSRLIDWLKLSS